MKADYEQAAQILTSEGVYLAEVNALEESEMQQRFQIQGFPTLKFFQAGQITDYKGGRSKDELVQWLRKKLGPAALDLVSTEDVEQAVADNEVVVVYFGEPEGNEFKVFESVGKRFDDIIFGIAKEGEKFAVDKSVMPVIKMFKKFDEKEVIYDRSMEEEQQLQEWIEYHWMEKLFNFTYRTAEKIFGAQKPVLFFFLDFKNKEHQEIRNNVIIKVAEQLRGKILIAESQIEEGMGERLAEFMQINSTMLPAVRIMQMTETEALTVEEVIQFQGKWEKGELKSVYKSEPVPQDNEQRVIKKVVSDNFDIIVRDQTLPELEALVKDKQFEDIVVGEMDATENEVEGLIIEGFPCIKYYPKDEKYQNINFQGEKTKLGFEKFLKGYHKEEQTKSEIKEETKTKEEKDEL